MKLHAPARRLPEPLATLRWRHPAADPGVLPEPVSRSGELTDVEVGVVLDRVVDLARRVSGSPAQARLGYGHQAGTVVALASAVVGPGREPPLVDGDGYGGGRGDGVHRVAEVVEVVESGHLGTLRLAVDRHRDGDRVLVEVSSEPLLVGDVRAWDLVRRYGG